MHLKNRGGGVALMADTAQRGAVPPGTIFPKEVTMGLNRGCEEITRRSPYQKCSLIVSSTLDPVPPVSVQHLRLRFHLTRISHFEWNSFHTGHGKTPSS